MQKQIKYKGISRIPSDNASFDGEMEEVYNLVNMHGELRPVVAPDTLAVAAGVTFTGDLIFVHKNQGFEHFIAMDGSQLKWYNFSSGTIGTGGNLTNIISPEVVRDTQGIGNTLMFITNKDIHYFLWMNDNYKYLGKEIPFPVINFDKQPVTTFSSGAPILTIWGNVLADFSADIQKIAKFTGTVSGGRSGRSSGGSRYSSATTSPDEAIVSSDFENAVKGPLHANLNKISEDGLHIYPFFIRYAIRMYDGSLIKHSMPILILPSKFRSVWVGIVDPSTDNKIGYEIVDPCKLVYSHIAFEELNNYKDLIQSIDVFMSEPVYTYLYDEHFNGIVETRLANGLAPDQIFGGTNKTNEEVLDEISSTGNFYYIHSISLDDLAISTSNKEIKVENINTLVNRELMSDDFQTHDHLIAERGFSYNNKLHISGVQRRIFNGFKLGYLRCYYFGAYGEAVHDLGSRAFVFYPGDISRMVLSNGVEGAYKERGDLFLKKHSRLNGSYFLDPNLDNINVDSVTPSQSTFFDLEIAFGSLQSVVNEPSKLFVSAFQNPFFFPVDSRVTLPVSNIISMASNTEAISQGQFGQFPLYVFTDDGVWMLEVNSDGKYLSRQPISREVASNPNILQLDNSLAFITSKGVTILNGNQTECISDIIRDNNARASKLDLTSFINAVVPEADRVDMQQIYQTDDIEVFLKGCNLAYEYMNGNGRIIAINGAYKYAYVFDILSKTWSKIKSDYKRAVNNYPDTYAQASDGSIKVLSSLGSSQTDIRVMYVTRPIKMEEVLFNLQWVKHSLLSQKVINTVIYASRDGITYQPVHSSKKKLLRITGSPFRYYKIAVIAELSPKDILTGIDITYEPKFTNRLR